MAKRANGDGDNWPRRDKEGKITSYRGAYFGPDGKRRYVSGKTKGETRSRLRQARSDADQGLIFDSPNLKVGEYLDRWLADSVRDTVRQRTFERYESIVRMHIKPALGRGKLTALTSAHVRALYRKKLDAGLAPRTVNYIQTTLHKALKDAVSDGLIPKNVVRRSSRHVLQSQRYTRSPPNRPGSFLRPLTARGSRLCTSSPCIVA